MVSTKKSVEEYYGNSDYDTTSTGSNESESSVQVIARKLLKSDSPTSKGSKEPKVKTPSKSLKKKFQRCFSNVEETEEVLNRYSCALVADILLQGNLYVTSNYFAFYSNVFGYVTRILIPILSVEKITKEKTAKILPNAVGIATAESRYVFGSLLSRDSTLEYLIKVWEKVKSESPLVLENDVLEEDLNSDEPRDNESGIDSPDSKEIKQEELLQEKTSVTGNESVSYNTKILPLRKLRKVSNSKYILVASTLLLVLLYLTASLLLYRINQIQRRYSSALGDLAESDSKIIYSDLLQWQTELYSKSDEAVHSFVDTNLVEIAKVKQSLEALSSLLENKVNPSAEELKKNTPDVAEGVS